MRRPTRRLGLALVASGLLLGLLGWWLAPTLFGDAPTELSPVRPPLSTWTPQTLALPPRASGTLTLGGQVLGPDGPVAGALVVALPTPSAAWRSLSFPPERSSSSCVSDSLAPRLVEQIETLRRDAVMLARSTTDAQGRFLLEGLGPDPFVLWAEQGALLGVRTGMSAGAHEARVHVRPGAWISSEVLDEQGAPLTGVGVTALVHAAGRVIDTVTGEDGRFVLGPLPELQAPLVLSRPGFPTTPRDILQLVRGPTILPTSHRLEGRVEDERGPVSGAAVQLESIPALDDVTTDAQGRFVLEGVCLGRHVLVARQGERVARRWVDVTPGRAGPPVELLLLPTLHLSGRVLDTSGQALPDAEVTASGGEPTQTLQARTDARGQFLLESLTPGSYTLTARAPHHAPESFPPRLFVDSQTLELTLKRAEALEGRVVDEQGVPVRGVSLQLASVRGADPEQALATSEADGHFLLEAPTARDWRVVASHPDCVPEEVTLFAPARDVRVVLRRGASLTTQVVDVDGQPVEDAEVSLNDGPQGRTDADGKAVFPRLPAGDYTVQACSTDQGLQSSALTLAARESRTVHMSLPRGGRLTGRVVDARGRAVNGADLQARLASSRPGDCRAPVPFKSDAEGHIALALSEGTWALSATTRGVVLDAEASRGVELVERAPRTQVRISAGESRVQLVLRASTQRMIRGRVVREDGRPVVLFQLNGREVRDPEGRFAVPFPQSRDVRIQAPDLAAFSRIFRLPVPKDIDLEAVVLHPLGRVEGTVVDALSSRPIARALVTLRTRSSRPASPQDLAYTRWDGHFTLEGVPPTDATLTLRHPLYPPLDVAFTPGQQAHVRLVPGATLEGHVESDGGPVEGATVQVRTLQGTIAATTALRQGRYAVELLPPGSYQVQVRGARAEGASVLFAPRPVELAAGERKTLDFTGPVAAVSIEVRVPEQGINVYLVPGDLPLLGPRQGLYNKLLAGFMGKRGSDTTRRFPLLPGGLYTLIAIREDEHTDVHRELMELPPEGQLTVLLTPLWTRFEE